MGCASRRGMWPAVCAVRDLRARKDPGPVTGEFAPVINSHGAGLCRVSPANWAEKQNEPAATRGKNRMRCKERLR